MLTINSTMTVGVRFTTPFPLHTLFRKEYLHILLLQMYILVQVWILKLKYIDRTVVTASNYIWERYFVSFVAYRYRNGNVDVNVNVDADADDVIVFFVVSVSLTVFGKANTSDPRNSSESVETRILMKEKNCWKIFEVVFVLLLLR